MLGLLGGATFLYNKLSANMDSNQLSVNNTPAGEIEEEGSRADSGKGEEANEEYTKAFDFIAYDAEGNAVKLSDFEGKPVVLNFWASWCTPCKSEMPEFEEAFKIYGENIHFLMVNMTDGHQETKTKAEKFVADSGYIFPVYYDSDLEAARAYSVYSIPTTYFIDKDGYIIAYGQGALDADTLQRGIDFIYTP